MKKIILIIALLLCTACYNYSELNELGLISALAIDYKDNEYITTFEVLLTKKDSEESSSKKSYTVTNSGKTIEEAMSNTASSLPKKPYLNHLEIILVSTQVNLLDISDYILRNNEITTNCYLVLSDTPKEILNFDSKNNPINSRSIKNLLENNNLTNLEEEYDFQISNLLNHKKDISLPTVSLDEEITLDQTSIYSYTTYVKKLSSKEQTTLKYLLNNHDFLIDSNIGSIKVEKSKTNIDYKDNKFIINTSINGLLYSLNKDYNLKQQSTYKDLINIYITTIKSDITSLIKSLKESNSNILGITDFENKDYEINVEVDINKTGSLFEVIS